MQTLVSAIVTTYKREPEMVIRAVNSVLAQTYPFVEIIVVDDSPDSFHLRNQVREAIESLRGKVKYIRHERNMGACYARNTGLLNANGEFVAFLDDDDEWLPEKIEKQISAFNSPSIALVYCGQMSINDVTGDSVIQQKTYIAGKVYEKLIWENFIGTTSASMIRKQCLLDIGGFDPLMRSAQDYDVWTRLAQHYDVAFVAEPLVCYHYHDGERISDNPQSRIAGQERFIQKNIEYLEGNKAAWWRRHVRLATEYGKDGKIGVALRLWAQSVKKCPMRIRENLYYLLKIFLYYVRSLRARKTEES